MKKPIAVCLYFLTICCLPAGSLLFAADNASNRVFFSNQFSDEVTAPEMAKHKNVVKINLSSLLVSGVSLQYERIITPRLSVSAGVNFRPEGQLPFAGFIKDAFVDEGEVNAHRFLDETKFSYLTLTPEIRFYPGSKGAPNGFYVAPFFRYGSWDAVSELEFDRDDEPPVDLWLSGDLSYYGGGLMLGFQRARNRITVDWWLLGPFIGSVDGKFAARGSEDIGLTEQEKRDIEKEVNDIDTGILDLTAKVGDDRVDLLVGGGILGIRAVGFTLGFRF